MDDDRIVELCSAANSAEAHALCAALEDAGIRAQVVGEMLGNAAGWLPLGQPIAPRIWVRQADLEQAQEAWAALQEEQGVAPGVSQDEETDDEKVFAVSDEAGNTQPAAQDETGAPLAVNSLGVLGFAIVCGSVLYAYVCLADEASYSERTKAALTGWEMHFSRKVTLSPRRELPVFGLWRMFEFSWSYDAHYTYLANGDEYSAILTDQISPPPAITVRYDPRGPAVHRVGAVNPGWLVLYLGVGAGLSFIFVGYQLR